MSVVSVMLAMLLAGCTEKGDQPFAENPETEKEIEILKTEPQEAGKNPEEIEIIPAVAIAKVQSVLNIELNAPNPRYQAVMHEIMNSSGSDQQKSADYDVLIESLYGPYFTEDGLYRLKMTGAFRFHLIEQTNYSLRLIESDIQQSDVKTASNQFNIQAVVELTIDGMEPERFDMTGKAVFNKKEGEIGDFYLENPGFALHDKLYEAVYGEQYSAD